MNEKISVLMTVYNEEKYLVDSINSILTQKYENFEFIIVDDFSSDQSKNIIRKINDKRIKFYELKEKLGRTKALNFGLKKCQSDFIAIQDADDIAHIDRFRICMEKFNDDKTIGLTGTNFEFIDSNNLNEKSYNQLSDYKKVFSNLKFVNFIPHSSIIFNRRIFDKNLFYDESFIYAQDYHLILKYLKNSKIYLIDKKLVKIRRHDSNMSNDKFYKKIRIKENIRLLNYSLKYLKLDFFEKKKIILYKIKNYIKLILSNLA